LVFKLIRKRKISFEHTRTTKTFLENLS
jgi:hypothetical protein